MPAADTRQAPLARFLIAAPGAGEPFKTREELTWLAPIAHEWRWGTFNRDSTGRALLQVVPEVGLVCRSFVTPKDTRLSQYGTSGGSWEERKPGTGAPRVYYLVQYDTTAGVQFSATSSFSIPANSSFAVSLTMAATPPDWDAGTTPQYVRFEWGNGQWGIHLDTENAYLVRWNAGAWEVVVDIPNARAFTGKQGEEQVFIVAVLRGRVGVSTDGGLSYVWGAGADPRLPVSIHAGTCTVRGQGGLVLYGLYQVLYLAGSFTSRNLNTLTSREFGLGATLSHPAAAIPSGCSITLADQSAPAAAKAAWRATLTPHASAAVPFSFYRTPELYSVLLEYPPLWSGGSGYYTEPFLSAADTWITHAEVSKPYELDQGSGSVQAQIPSDQAFVWAPGRWSKAQLLLGHVNQDGTVEFLPAMTGYVKAPSTKTAVYRDCSLTLALEHLTLRFKRTRWTKRTRPYFRGLSVNQALDRILYSEVLFDDPFFTGPDFSRYRLWHVAGNIPIPESSPEDPSEYEYPPLETKWETIERLCGLACLEFGAADAGGFFTLPKDSFNPILTQLWEDVPTAELIAFVRSLNFTLRGEESATAVEVYGKTEFGEEVLAWALNERATVLGAADFCPWRETICEDLNGTVTPGVVTARAQSIARQRFPLQFEADVATVVRLGISRRDMGQITGFEQVGIAPYDRFAVLSLQHVYEADPSFERCTTTAGLRRLD